MKKIVFISILLLVTTFTYAEDWIEVYDMSLLKYQLSPTGLVYIRNLHKFNLAALNNNSYHYYIDTTTPAGKILWATVLVQIATSGKFTFGVVDITKGGPITYAGNF